MTRIAIPSLFLIFLVTLQVIGQDVPALLAQSTFPYQRPQYGGFEIGKSKFYADDSLKLAITEAPNSLSTNSYFSILEFDNLGSKKNKLAIIEGYQKVNLLFKDENWVYFCTTSEIDNKVSLYRNNHQNTSLIQQIPGLKLNQKSFGFALTDHSSDNFYLFYNTKPGEFLVYPFDPKRGQLVGGIVIEAEKKHQIHNIFLANGFIYLLESSIKTRPPDLFLTQFSLDGTRLSRTQINSPDTYFELYLMRLDESENKLILTGRSYNTKKSEFRSTLTVVSCDLTSGQYKLSSIPQKFNLKKTIWMDVVPFGSKYYLIGEDFWDSDESKELAMHAATAILSGGLFSVAVASDKFLIKDLTIIEIDKKDFSISNSETYPLPEVELRMPDLPSYELAALVKDLGAFRYLGTTMSGEVVLKVREDLCTFNLDSKRINKVMRVGGLDKLRMPTPSLKPILLPDHGIVLQNQETIHYIKLPLDR